MSKANAGLALWLLLNLLGVVRMEVVRRRFCDLATEDISAGRFKYALPHAHLIYMFGGTFVSIALSHTFTSSWPRKSDRTPVSPASAARPNDDRRGE